MCFVCFLVIFSGLMASFKLRIGSRIGVVSDTHGLLRPEVEESLRGVPVILHAGDVGHVDVLRGLNAIAPTVAVRGNVDRGDFGATLPMNEPVEIGKRLIYLYHILEDLDIDPPAANVDLVITGHSHQPGLDQKNGVTYLNPGSCGPRRFSLPVALAFLTVTRDGFDIEQVELDV